MTRILFRQFCLVMSLALVLCSCRHDYLPEKENTYNNSSAFHLTSKRIPLNEAKHKAKLVPEIKKAEAEIEAKFKAEAKGKVVNYGNGVSIDTDEVIYIENGPDFYTYTFRIMRENAPADAPVENLVLSPLSDGSWKEELITYHLTAPEKETMITGGVVDLKGKVDHTLLQSGTYAPEIMQRVICYDYVDAFYTPCSEGIHHNGEEAGDGPGQCQAAQQSVLMVTVTRRCKDFGTGSGNEVGTAPGGFLTPPGGSEPSGPGDGSNPQPCSSVPSQPQDPSATIGGNANTGCNTGTPTLPNLGTPVKGTTPCARVNEQASEKTFKDNLKALIPKLGLGSETGYRMDYKDQNPTAPQGNGINNQFIQSKAGTTHIEFTYFLPATYAIIHTHYNSMNDPIFSPEDIIQFNQWLVAAKAWNDNPANLPKIDLRNLSYTVVTDYGNYMLTFDGTNVTPLTGYDIDDLNVNYIKDVVGSAATQYPSGEVSFDMNKLEENLLKFSKKYLSMPGMKLFKLGSDGINKEIFLDSNNKRETNNCN